MRILKDKYCKSNNSFRAFASGSHLWKGMGKVCDRFKDKIQLGIGNGSSLFFRNDWCISSGSLRFQIQGPLQKDDHWDFSMISFSLPENLFNQCQSTNYPKQSYNSQDFMFLDLTFHGKFDFSVAILDENLNENGTLDWELSWTWKIITPPKI